MIEEMISKFNNQSGENAFIRVDDKHILDLYIGFDKSANYSILLVSDLEPIKLTSSLIIDVEVFQRKDLRWTTVVSLKQVQYLDLFYQVSYDLIESSRSFLSEVTAQSFFFERYKKWQNLLKRNRKGLLGPQEIKGLIGELFFLKMFMLNSFDLKESIESWTGPEKTKQDFILQDTWFEVKSITSSAGQVRISSISQLDTTKDGYLATVKLDKTSSLDIEKITLNSLYEEILQMLENDQIKLEFENKLFEFGYINRKEYDYETYRFMGIEFFRVNQNFPKLLREKLPSEIVEATYEISLSGIEDFRVQKSIKKLGDLWN